MPINLKIQVRSWLEGTEEVHQPSVKFHGICNRSPLSVCTHDAPTRTRAHARVQQTNREMKGLFE